MFYPPPPDLTDTGYASAVFDFFDYDRDDDQPPPHFETSDPVVVNGLLRTLADGTHAVNCRCIYIARVTVSRPDGSTVELQIMPSHSDKDGQILIGGHRYSVNRNQMLAALAPLGIPPERWVSHPD